MMGAMQFDIWLPTANPFTTSELLAVIAGEAEDRASTPSGSVSMW
jgi:hypothetical protein